MLKEPDDDRIGQEVRTRLAGDHCRKQAHHQLLSAELSVRALALRAGQGATTVLLWAGLLKAGLVSGALVAIAVRTLIAS
jgi:hypothetical protein